MKKPGEISITWITFISSFSTLFCCTLPVIFSLIGASTVFGSLISHFAWLSYISEYKFTIFIFSASMLLLTNIIIRIPIQSCPTDPILRAKCSKFRTLNKRLLMVSTLIWLISFYFAYLAFPIKLGMEL
jgi:mercuric ion transport protein